MLSKNHGKSVQFLGRSTFASAVFLAVAGLFPIFLPTMQSAGSTEMAGGTVSSATPSPAHYSIGLIGANSGDETQSINAEFALEAGIQAPARIPRETIARTEQVILMTGFEPFGGRDINSSWEAVSRLDGMRLEDGERVVAVELPVLWESADDRLREAIDQYNPIVVINVGQGGYGFISLERNAHNYNDALPDNSGMIPASPHISQVGPAVFSTKFDLYRMLELFADEAIPAQISTTAGGYLCNFVSYNSYDYLYETNPRSLTLFVHVPPIDNLNEQEKLLEIIKALRIIVAEASRQVGDLTFP